MSTDEQSLPEENKIPTTDANSESETPETPSVEGVMAAEKVEPLAEETPTTDTALPTEDENQVEAEDESVDITAEPESEPELELEPGTG